MVKELNPLLETLICPNCPFVVVHNVGLCIALWDLKEIKDSFLFPGDGASHTVVHFRYVVFRPYMDEILVGKIKGSSKDGVQVSLGFFDDILIPSDALQHPSRFDEQEQLWVWLYEAEDEKHDLFMDIGEEIRFRVVDETFVDTTPTSPETGTEETDVLESDAKKVPYTLTVSTLWPLPLPPTPHFLVQPC
eukprot:XP_014775460.1 PREDICTED: DNA-directed RNA polymerase III subunit RPC8-like [Octopus bimaculoides]